MPFCHVCNKDKICENFSTIGNQVVCCLSCVGLLKSNKDDECSCCRRPVWKDNYYEINNSFVCSEKCKNIIEEKLIKEKGVKDVKFRHFNEQKFYNSPPKIQECDELKEEKKENIINQEKILIDPEQSNNDICNIINEMCNKNNNIENNEKIYNNDIKEENENDSKLNKSDNNDKNSQSIINDKNDNIGDNNDSSNIKDTSNNKDLSNIKDISNIKDSNGKIRKIDSNYSIDNNNESNDNNINNIDNNVNNDWNKNSFIQKESENNENTNQKDELKMVYKIQKSSHRKKKGEIKEFFFDDKKGGNEKESLIKNMKKYFAENKTHKLKRNQKSKIKMKFNLFNIEKIKKTENEINIQSSQNIFSVPNFSLTNNNSINNFKVKEDNPFTNKIEKNTKNEKKMYEARSTNSLTLENSLNTTITKLNSNTILFNPVRKSEDIFKKNSYPVDSLTFPIDSLSLPNQNIKGSSVNICNNCRKPILIRNNNTHKDFCSVSCRNEYYNDL